MNKGKILIVEDEAFTATLLEQSLTHSGYTITGVVPSGEEALEKVENTRPDLVLMDINLVGEKDGIEAAGEIHTRYGIPVIYLTAFADKSTLMRARETEPQGYILKPIREEELFANIEMSIYKSKIEALRQRERELNGVLNGLDQGVIAFDNTNHTRFMNSQAEAALGVTFAEAQDMQADEIVNCLNQKSTCPISRDMTTKDEEGNATGRILVFNVQ